MGEMAGRSSKRLMASVGLVLTMVGLAGCGEDSVKAGKANAQFADYCGKSFAIETYPEPDIDFQSLSPDQLKTETKAFAAKLLPLAEQVRAVSPAEIKNDINVLADAVRQVTQTGDFEAAFESPAANAASDRAHVFDLANCGWAKVDISGEDYKFVGVPKKFEAGPVSFEFTNKGKEPHELMLFRVNDGVKESVKEIVGLPQKEGQAKITRVGGTFAPPGEADYAVADLKKGRYGVACFVPVGGGDDGPPHASKGMHAEFTVT